VDSLSPPFVGRFELLGAHAAEMTVTPRPIVERIDVVSDIGERKRSVFIDLFFNAFLFHGLHRFECSS
jgi:hypothetical protein